MKKNTQDVLMDLFDYFRTEGKTEHEKDNYLCLVNAALNIEIIEELYNSLGRILPKLRAMNEEIKKYLQ